MSTSTNEEMKKREEDAAIFEQLANVRMKPGQGEREALVRLVIFSQQQRANLGTVFVAARYIARRVGRETNPPGISRCSPAFKVRFSCAYFI